jgi:hypothetical protein
MRGTLDKRISQRQDVAGLRNTEPVHRNADFKKDLDAKCP